MTISNKTLTYLLSLVPVALWFGFPVKGKVCGIDRLAIFDYSGKPTLEDIMKILLDFNRIGRLAGWFTVGLFLGGMLMFGLSGCATDDLMIIRHSLKSCDDVTISKREGANHAQECEIRPAPQADFSLHGAGYVPGLLLK